MKNRVDAMPETYISREIRRASRNLLIANLLILAAIAGLLAAYRPNIKTPVQGVSATLRA